MGATLLFSSMAKFLNGVDHNSSSTKSNAGSLSRSGCPGAIFHTIPALEAATVATYLLYIAGSCKPAAATQTHARTHTARGWAGVGGWLPRRGTSKTSALVMALHRPPGEVSETVESG